MNNQWDSNCTTILCYEHKPISPNSKEFVTPGGIIDSPENVDKILHNRNISPNLDDIINPKGIKKIQSSRSLP